MDPTVTPVHSNELDMLQIELKLNPAECCTDPAMENENNKVNEMGMEWFPAYC